MDFLSFQIRSAIIGNYKDDRLFGRGEEYAESVIVTAIEDAKKTGSLSISRFESINGRVVDFKIEGAVLIEI